MSPVNSGWLPQQLCSSIAWPRYLMTTLTAARMPAQSLDLGRPRIQAVVHEQLLAFTSNSSSSSSCSSMQQHVCVQLSCGCERGWVGALIRTMQISEEMPR
jgi:hypothetical protein